VRWLQSLNSCFYLLILLLLFWLPHILIILSFRTWSAETIQFNDEKMNTKSIVSRIRKELKRNGNISTQKDIQITLLKETLNTYFEAEKLLKENGYLMVFNDGKTKGQNPMLKVKFDSLKIIIKLINDIFKDIDEDDSDAFIEWLTNG